MIKTTLQKDLTTVSTLDGKNSVSTAFLDPRSHANPGELLACALGACMLTMVGYMASKRAEKAEGTSIEVRPQFDEKHSRITGFALRFIFPASFTQTQKEMYARAAQTCPVHNSLREDMVYTVEVL